MQIVKSRSRWMCRPKYYPGKCWSMWVVIDQGRTIYGPESLAACNNFISKRRTTNGREESADKAD